MFHRSDKESDAAGGRPAAWFSLELVLQEAFQVLVLTRMLIRRESEYRGATAVTYVLGPDGRAAQIRGDVAAVVARRLPD